MIRLDSITFLKRLIGIANEYINFYQYKIERKQMQIERWNDQLLEIERNGMYKQTKIGFKLPAIRSKTSRKSLKR